MRVKIASSTKPPTEFADRLEQKKPQKRARDMIKNAIRKTALNLGPTINKVLDPQRAEKEKHSNALQKKASCCLELNTKLKIPSKTYVMYLHLSNCKYNYCLTSA